ncbi:hypothetical protein LZ31DRAFT_539848 [Colletotrichum somersetense]|nr:hypothetical protein LZ31DRAFT_539848 [Colletotrichum somersetense]
MARWRPTKYMKYFAFKSRLKGYSVWDKKIVYSHHTRAQTRLINTIQDLITDLEAELSGHTGNFDKTNKAAQDTAATVNELKATAQSHTQAISAMAIFQCCEIGSLNLPCLQRRGNDNAHRFTGYRRIHILPGREEHVPNAYMSHVVAIMVPVQMLESVIRMEARTTRATTKGH